MLRVLARSGLLARAVARQQHRGMDRLLASPGPDAANRRISCASQPPSGTAPTAGTTADGGSGPSRAFPREPRVGVGVVVFRTPPIQGGPDPDVLLVRRAKEPDKGRWCLPGGSLELGETLAACAAREVQEEAGLSLCGGALPPPGPGNPPPPLPSASLPSPPASSYASAQQQWNLLSGPTPFAAVDVIRKEADGGVKFHYAVIEVAAICTDPDAVLVPGDDADGAMWVPLSKMRGMENLTVQCDDMAEEAHRRFAMPAAAAVEAESA